MEICFAEIKNATTHFTKFSLARRRHIPKLYYEKKGNLVRETVG